MNMKKFKHCWTFDEDKLCCKRYLEFFILNKSNLKLKNFILILENDLPNINRGSLKMKIQNIKQILIEKQIEDTLELKTLANYSKQNLRAMSLVLEKTKIDIKAD